MLYTISIVSRSVALFRVPLLAVSTGNGTVRRRRRRRRRRRSFLWRRRRRRRVSSGHFVCREWERLWLCGLDRL